LHVLRVRPDDPDAVAHLGEALREQGRLEQAAVFLRHAVCLRPDRAEAHHHLGQTLAEQGRPEEAEAAYREALRLRPDSVAALSSLGALLEEMNRPDEGRPLVERALALGPDQYQALVHDGTSLVTQGRFAEAEAAFLRALAVRPDGAAAWFYLARDAGHAFRDDEVARLRALLDRDGLPLRDRINLHFALARVLDRAGACDEAFAHCDRGNAVKRELLLLQNNAYRPDEHTRFVDRLIAVFGPAFFERVRGFGDDSDLPVFVVGMPRSGTSLVEQILASHPAVHGAGELRHVQQLAAGLPAELGAPEPYPDCLAGLSREAARRLAGRHLEAMRRLGGGRARVVDKMPMNFHHLGLIAALLPRARVLHCRRDPRDSCWSCYFQNFREVPFACDLRALGGYYRQYERLMDHWRRTRPLPILDVQYEELVEAPERLSREMVAFCGLPWNPGCLEHHRTRRPVRTASNRQVRQPIYKTAVGYWRNYAAHLGPLLEALGAGGVGP
jgi:Flp pilus assembly protein TadD